MSEPINRNGDESLDRVLAGYMVRLDRGEEVDRETLLADHPELAFSLQEFFLYQESVEEALRKLGRKPPQPLDAPPGPNGDQATTKGWTCPRCRNVVEWQEDEACEAIVCPTCQSRFPVDLRSNAAWSLKTPKQLADRFELIEKVGVGSFGVVYRAQDLKLQRTVAVKVPRLGALATSEDLDRFIREARSVAQLSHPNIVPVYDVGHFDGVPYLVSEFVLGETLRERMTSSPLSPHKTAEVVASVADCLDYAHRQGVVHRDVKSSNVILDENGIPKLMDFGLSKRDTGEITMTLDGQVLGTPAYMSPEQAAGQSSRVDGRSDVYSLGVVMYELLAGELPFRGTTGMLINQLLQDEPRRPSSLNEHVPRDLETICLKAMAKEPTRRYSTAAKLSEDLRRFSRGEPIRARPVGTAVRLWRWCKRNPLVASLMALLVSMVLFVSVAAAVIALREARMLKRTQGLLAESHLDQGLAYCEKGQIAQGLLLLAHALKTTPFEAIDLQRAIRLNLAFWRTQLVAQPRRSIPQSGTVFSIAVSPEGSKILTGATDGTARLWDAVSGEAIGRPMQHQSAIRAVAFSPDGSRLLTGSRDQTAQLWHTSTTEPDGDPLPHPGEIRAVAFSPDGTQFVTGCADGLARLWDTDSKKSLGAPIRHEEPINGVAFHPDGARLLTGSSDGTAQLWDLNSGLPIGEPFRHGALVSAVAFAPDGKLCATASGDRTVRLWDVQSGEPIGEAFQHEAPVWSVAFSPDGKSLITGSEDRAAQVWEIGTGKRIGAPLAHSHPVRAVAFGSNDSTVVTGGNDWLARIWDVNTTSLQMQLLRHEDAVLCLAFSSDGTQIVTGTASPQKGVAQIWDVWSGKPIGYPMVHPDKIRAVAFSPDGELILTGSDDRAARFWSAQTGELVGIPLPHQSRMEAVAFSPTGAMAATGTDGGTARLWDVRTGEPIGPGFVDNNWQVLAVPFSPDGKTVFAGRTLLSVGNGEPVGEKFPFHGAQNDAAFSRDGLHLLTGAADNAARIWNIEKQAPVGAAFRHQGPVLAVAYHPNEEMIVTGSADNTAQLWHIATRKPVGPPFTHEREVFSVAFSPDGSLLATGSPDKTVRIWELPPPLMGDVDQINLWVEVATGMERTPNGEIRLLEPEVWQTRCERLRLVDSTSIR